MKTEEASASTKSYFLTVSQGKRSPQNSVSEEAAKHYGN
jgi:hypothetical protein